MRRTKKRRLAGDADPLAELKKLFGKDRARKADSTLVSRRVAAIAELIVGGWTSRKIVQHAAGFGGLSPRSLRDYIRRARALIENEICKDHGELTAVVLERYDKVYCDALLRGDLETALRATSDLSKFAGLTKDPPPTLQQPQQVRVFFDVPDKQPMREWIEASDDQS